MNIARLSVRYPVSVNLIMATIFLVGVVLYMTQMPKDLFPSFSLNKIVISTVYPGVSPEEIEKNITIKIEDAIDDIDNIDEISSTSQEGLSTIKLEISPEAKSTIKVINDIRQAIESIEEFPDDAEDPVIQEVTADYPIITVSLYGDINLIRLKDIVEELQEEIKMLPGVSDVNISGLPERELWVEIDPEALERFGLTFKEISDIVGASNFDLPGGSLPTTEGEFLIRTIGKASYASELKKIPIKSDRYGGRILLGDIAEIKDWFARETSLGRFNMARSVNMNITKTKSGDAVKLTRSIRRLIEEYSLRLPPTVKVGVFNDMSVYIENRFKILSTSGAQGLSIVFLLLFLMLNLRVSFMVSLGIPISFLGAIIIMTYTGMTMNMIAMFAFIVVLGMVVDDAVVIGENIYRHYEEGLPPSEAAVKGATEMTAPVLSAVLTTTAAFLPLLMIPGKMGKFLGVIPMVVIFTLMVSLIEALFILPSHMADFLPEKIPEQSKWRKRFDLFFARQVERYENFLSLVLTWRYVSISTVGAITAIIVVYAIFHLPFVLFHSFEGSQFFINIEAPASNSLEDTEAFTERIESAIKSGIDKEIVKSIVTNVGYIFDDMDSLRRGRNLSQVIVELNELGEGRKLTIKDVIDDVRTIMEPFRKEAVLHIKELAAGPSSHPVYIQITGKESETILEIAKELKSYIMEFPGVFDLRDNFEAGKPEIKIKLKPHAYNLGLTDRYVAQEIRNGFWGVRSSKFQTRAEDIDVVVKMPEQDKKRLSALFDYKITLPEGEKIPLVEIADIHKTGGASQIIRENQKRAISITGDLDQTKTTSKELAEKVEKKFSDLYIRYPGYSINTGKGEMKDIEQSLSALKAAFLIGALLIYFILGTQFKSYIQPVLVMAAIPFGINGVIVGHVVMGKSLGLLSIIGLVALSGIVVNDSLILVDFINKLRERGVGRIQSIIKSAKLRVRPVILTSITTMGGLFMLTFFSKGQAKFLSPMAISIFWGLLFSTVIILIIVPCLYAILDDLTIFFRKGDR